MTFLSNFLARFNFITIKYFICLPNRSLRNGGKRSAFLVNTVVLANQQVECIRKATALKVAIYTGDQNVDAWRRDRWSEEFENHQVLSTYIHLVIPKRILLNTTTKCRLLLQHARLYWT